jgi:hypothetical protein
MATRTTQTAPPSVYGGNFNLLIGEFNKLVAEVEELKAAYKVHTHSAVSSKAPDGSAGAGFNQTMILPEAQKVG